MAVTLFSASKLEKYKKLIQRRNRYKAKANGYIDNFDVNELEQDLLEGEYRFMPFDIRGKEKRYYQCTSLQDEVVMRSLNKIIKGLYKVRQADRNLMVKQMISLLEENHEKHIYRLDIKNFYEKISLYKSVDKLIKDGLMAAEYEQALWSLYEQLKSNLVRVDGIKGLPRGLSISATLSEIYMRDFDNAVRQLEGVYYYARFVDDIIVFSTSRIDVKKQLVTVLPEGLRFNSDKTKCLAVCNSTVKKQNATKSYGRKMDFLGYCFSFEARNNSSSKEKNQVSIGLSANKLAKMKQRLHNSFWYYRTRGKPALLKKRVQFLTSSFAVAEVKSDSDTLYSGLYYNYQRMNDFTQLVTLDKLLHYYINLSPEYARFTVDQRLKQELSECSFVMGFKTREKRCFSPKEIKKIKGIWNEY